jgi:catechol 2,3-dioxygenase-like lactoylglutathione lyase family enzyme
MIDHININVADLEASKQFYKSVLSTLGYVIRLEREKAVSFGSIEIEEGGDPGGSFWISKGEPFVPRSHFAFRASSEQDVIAFYNAALEAGATPNGAPGLRPHFHKQYYAAFVLDPDGYNIEAVFHKSGSEDASP